MAYVSVKAVRREYDVRPANVKGVQQFERFAPRLRHRERMYCIDATMSSGCFQVVRQKAWVRLWTCADV